MSELLHPGEHPDADQLSAFAEGVLPGHERVEMLAHLAECADCRQMVFLAQRTEPAEVPPSDAPAGPVSWWKNWGHLWPVAAALACGLLVAAFLQSRQSRNIPQKSDAAFESAAAAVSPLQKELPAAVVPEVRPPEIGPRASGPSRRSTTTSKAGSSPHPPLAVPGSALDEFSSMHGSLATDHQANNRSAFSADAPVSSQKKNGAFSADSSSLSSALGFPVPKPTSMQEQQNNPFNDGAQSRVLKAQNQIVSQRAAAARPLGGPRQSEIQRSASQTVAVTNEAPVLQTENAVVSSDAIGGPIPLRPIPPYPITAPLPSKLPAISTISNEHETLAVDSAGDVFTSQDGGRGWRQIAHQWAGKAVKVRLASPNSMTETAPSLSASSTSSINSEAARAAPVARRVGFELVTDTGAIWSSPDGLVWKQR